MQNEKILANFPHLSGSSKGILCDNMPNQQGADSLEIAIVATPTLTKN